MSECSLCLNCNPFNSDRSVFNIRDPGRLNHVGEILAINHMHCIVAISVISECVVECGVALWWFLLSLFVCSLCCVLCLSVCSSIPRVIIDLWYCLSAFFVCCAGNAALRFVGDAVAERGGPVVARFHDGDSERDEKRGENQNQHMFFGPDSRDEGR